MFRSQQDLESLEFLMKKTRAYEAGERAYKEGKPRNQSEYTTTETDHDKAKFILEDCFWNGYDISEKKVKDLEKKSKILGYVDLSKFKKRN